MSEIVEPVESNEQEKMAMFFKLKQDYIEERKKIISQLYKKKGKEFIRKNKTRKNKNRASF